MTVLEREQQGVQRRPSPAARPAPRGAHGSYAAPTPSSLPRPTVAPAAAPAAPAVRRRPAAAVRRGSRGVRRIGWRSPMSAAVLFASFGVSLLCLYVSAYARVTQEGNDLVRLRRELSAAQQEGRDLEAGIDALRHPATVNARAKALGMVPAPTEAQQFLTLPSAPAAAGADAAR